MASGTPRRLCGLSFGRDAAPRHTGISMCSPCQPIGPATDVFAQVGGVNRARFAPMRTKWAISAAIGGTLFSEPHPWGLRTAVFGIFSTFAASGK